MAPHAKQRYSPHLCGHKHPTWATEAQLYPWKRCWCCSLYPMILGMNWWVLGVGERTLFLFSSFFLLFGAVLTAYGSARARGWIGAAVACLHHSHSHTSSSHNCNLHHNSWQRWILDLLSEAREQTHILMDTSRIHHCWVTRGTLAFSFNWLHFLTLTFLYFE